MSESLGQVIIGVLSIIAIILSLVAITPDYEYEFKVIELNNNNVLIYEHIVDYVCSEGVEVRNENILGRIINGPSFYASTWGNPKTSNGSCAIKIRRVAQK